VATTFYAGQRVTAADLAGALPLLGWAKNDTSKTSSTTLSDATGLAVTLDASATYAIDAYLAYVAVEAADIKISLSAPVGSSGHWALMPLAAAATGSLGNLDATRQVGFGDSVTQNAAGSSVLSGQMMCQPHAYVVTSGAAGLFQVRFAQATSSASPTLIKAGSWVRALRLA
jgi:hypothetical protein